MSFVFRFFCTIVQNSYKKKTFQPVNGVALDKTKLLTVVFFFLREDYQVRKLNSLQLNGTAHKGTERRGQ